MLELRQSSFRLVLYYISDIIASQVNNVQVICWHKMHVRMIFLTFAVNTEVVFAPTVYTSYMLDFLSDCC